MKRVDPIPGLKASDTRCVGDTTIRRSEGREGREGTEGSDSESVRVGRIGSFVLVRIASMGIQDMI